MQILPHTLAIFHLAVKIAWQMFNVAEILGGWLKKNV